MKKLLPLLISYVLMQSQCFAISGGPDYGGSGGNVSTTGSYSGTIQGVTEVDPTTTGAPPIPGDPVPGGTTDASSSNALGIFNLIVNGTTTSTGSFLLFADGVVFGGSISASVDPDSDKLNGILDGTFNFSITTFNATGDPTSTAVTATAVGMIAAKITASGGHSTSAARLNGTANLEISFGEYSGDLSPVVDRVITFTVSGFQTTTSTAASTASTIGTAGSAGSNG